MIKEAEEWAEPLYHILYPDTHNDVMITPILTETTASARIIDPNKRNCLFSVSFQSIQIFKANNHISNDISLTLE